MLNLSDSRNFSRTLAALGLSLGPFLFFVGTVIDPAWADDTGDYLQAIADAPGTYTAAGVLWTIGALLFIPGMLGVMKLMRGKGVTLGQVGAGLIATGLILFASAMAFYGVDVVLADFADREAAVQIADGFEDSAAVGTMYMISFLAGVVLGSVLLAIALLRRHIVPIWSPALLVASTVLGFVGETQMLSAASLLLLVAGLFPLSQRIWHLSDEAWGRWEPLAGEPGASTVSSSPVDPAPA